MADAFTADAKVEIVSPRRYLGQLCKHFAHKLPASYDELFAHGRIDFPMGPCILAADQEKGELHLRVEAASDEDLSRLENVVASHLVRFAFRAEDMQVNWVRTGA